MGWTHTRAEIARTIRDNPTADVTELRRQLRAERLEQYVRDAVGATPPLTPEQRARVATLLTEDARAAQRGSDVAA